MFSKALVCTLAVFAAAAASHIVAADFNYTEVVRVAGSDVVAPQTDPRLRVVSRWHQDYLVDG
jgi:hypothetical protein